MLTLLDLPPEVLTEIAEKLEDRFHRGSLSNFSKTCKHIHGIIIPVLYRCINYTEHFGAEYGRLRMMERLLRTSVEVRKHLRELILDDWIFDGNGVNDTVMHNFLSNARNLQYLKIAYPANATFLNIKHPRLETVRLRPIGLYSAFRDDRCPTDGPLNVAFLPDLLQSPRLLDLSMEATYIHSSATDLDWARLQGPPVLVSLTIVTRSISVHVLGQMLKALPDLGTLRLLGPPARSSLGNLVRTDHFRATENTNRIVELNYNFPPISSIGNLLRKFCQSLRHLTLSRCQGYWTPNLDCIGSLHTLTSLRVLDLPATMLLGWRHCQHISSDFSPLNCARLLDLLPPHVEELTLCLEEFHSARNDTAYVWSIAEILTKNLEVFPNLWAVGIVPSSDPYCLLCESNSGGILPERNQRIRQISIQELQSTMKLFVDAGICFGYRCRYKLEPQLWDEDFNDKMHPPPSGLITEW